MRGFIAGATSTGLSVVSGSRRHHDQRGLAREADVTDLALVVQIEQLREYPIGRESADRQRRDKLLCRIRHYRAHGRAALA